MEGIGIDIQLLLDDAEFDKDVDGLNKKLLLLKKEVKALNKALKLDPKNIENLTQKWENLKAQEILAYKEVEKYKQTVENLQKQGIYSGEEINNAIAGQEKVMADLKGIQRQIKVCEDQLRGVTDQTQIWADKFDIVSKVAGKIADKIAPMSKLASQYLGNVAQSAMEFESAFADVRKTVEATEDQFGEMEDGLRDLATTLPYTASELSKIAGLAGQMNVPAEAIVDFTESIAEFAMSTNISAEEAVQEIAQIYNVIGKGGDYSDLDNLLSTIVDLGNNSATTEKDIVEMFKNISSASSRVGMTETQMVALATTLSSLGLDKGGASAISNIMTQIDMAVDTNADTLSDWAKSAGMSVKEFKQLWGQDASGALVALIGNLQKTAEEGGSLNSIFDDLNIKELRRVDTLGRLVNGYDLYVDALERAEGAYEVGSALEDEASKRIATLESQVQILKNNFTEFALSLGDILLPYIKEMVAMIGQLADWLNNLQPHTKMLIARLLVITASLKPLLTVFSKVTGVLGNVLRNIKPLSQYINILKGAIEGLWVAVAKILGPIMGWITAHATLVLGIVALIAILVTLYNKCDWFRGIVDKVIDGVKELWRKFKETNWIEKLGEKFGWLGEIIGGIIELVKLLVGWFGQLISKVGEFLGISSSVSTSVPSIVKGANSRVNGYRNEVQSGGYGSGGITLNANFSVNSNGVTRADVKSWASWLADDINEELGRRIYG